MKQITSGAWEFVKGIITGNFDQAKAGLDSAIGGLKSLLGGAWDDIKRGASAAWEGIAGAIRSAFNGVVGGIKGVINDIIDSINDLIRGFNSLPGPDLPTIPHLATGTKFFEGGLAMVGEKGPELVTLPRGSRVTPADETKALLREAAPAQQQTVASNSFNLTINTMPENVGSLTNEFAFLSAMAPV